MPPLATSLIEKSPAFFDDHGMDWVGCGWTSMDNIKQWVGAVRGSKRAKGKKSKASGLLGTNWGGGRIESGMVRVFARHRRVYADVISGLPPSVFLCRTNLTTAGASRIVRLEP